MDIEYNSVPLATKSIQEEEGIIEHLIAVYGVVDYKGDIAHPGMFTKTLSERSKQVRVIAAHNHKDVMSVVGVPLDFKEVGREGLPQEVQDGYPEATGGMIARTRFLLDTPEGKGVFQRIKAGAIGEFSYGYNALDYDYSTVEVKGKSRSQRVRNLRTVRLWEYGPAVIAANPAAVTVSIKDIFVEPAFEEKSDNLTQLLADIRESFWRNFEADVRAVHEGYVVAKQWESTVLYKVPYTIGAEGEITFSPREEWVAGSYEFVEIAKEEPPEVEEEASFDPFEISKERWEISSILGRAG